jgi:hypothetical protein
MLRWLKWSEDAESRRREERRVSPTENDEDGFWEKSGGFYASHLIFSPFVYTAATWTE